MKPLRLAWIHPTLGLGGAERLVVDAARGLAARGHEVTIFTTQHDPNRSFVPRDAAFGVETLDSEIPRDVFGRLRAPLALLRLRFLIRRLAGRRGRFDAVAVDLTPHVVPALKQALGAPVAVYCHYPDVLLSPPQRGLYALYRRPINAREERGLLAADRVWVNSRFTQSVYQRVFPGAPAPEVLYPGVDTAMYETIPPPEENAEPLLLSINRFSPGKNLELALRAFASLPDELRRRARLTFAGGVDRDSAPVIAGLRSLASRLGVADRVELTTDPSEPERLRLLERAHALVYTPVGEHFGLGPVEAMAAARPVIAAVPGGPEETIVPGETGFLAEPTPEAFAEAAERLLRDPARAGRMGENGRERARSEFGLGRFAERLEWDLERLRAGERD